MAVTLVDRLFGLFPAPAFDGPEPRLLFDRIARLPGPVLLGAAGLVFTLLSYLEMRDQTNTSDEGVHLTAGYSYVDRGDFRLNPEHPPLGKILAAAPLFLMDLRWPEDDEAWRHAAQWNLSFKLLFHSGNDPDRILFWARVPTLWWGLILLGSVFAVARELYGPRGGLVALVLATFSSMILANAHLVTTDVVMAALFFLVLVAFDKLFRYGGYRWGVYAGVLLGGALAAKFSAILLVPLVLWMGTITLVRKLRATAALRAASMAGPALQWSLYVIVVTALALLTLWGTYGFRQNPSPDRSYEFDWSHVATVSGGLGGKAFLALSKQGILPDAYVYGYFMVQKHAQEGHPAFALGRFSQHGWWWYFPFAFLVKTSTGSLLLMGWGLLAVLDRIRAGRRSEDFLVSALILFWVMAIFTTINIGVRHILPVCPILMTLAGGIDLSSTDPARTVRLRRAASAFLILAVVECLSAAPFFLADFNVPARILFDPRDLLADSNLDWGQDLSRLKKVLDGEGIRHVKLSYFGCGSPRHVGLSHEVLLPANNAYLAYEKDWPTAGPIRPGDVVVISASNYAGFLLGDRDAYRRRFSRLKPVHVVGGTIYVYRIPEGFQ